MKVLPASDAHAQQVEKLRGIEGEWSPGRGPASRVSVQRLPPGHQRAFGTLSDGLRQAW
jgi:hypothetical protein